MNEKRYEFSIIRRNLLKETTYGEFICARCGHFSSSINIHHMRELLDGGSNNTENFIPLCGECHHEWDVYKATGTYFEQFLISLPSSSWAVLMNLGVFKTSVNMGLLAQHVYKLQFLSASTKYQYKHKCDVFEYFDELKRQNKIFNAYPYSDNDLMLELYGDVYETADDTDAERIIQDNQVRVCKLLHEMAKP